MFYTSAGIKMNRGKYRGYLYYKDATGKWKQRTKTLSAHGKAEAKRELALWRAEMENQAEADSLRPPQALEMAKQSVPDYVDKFINSLEVRKAVEATTILSYRNSAKHIRSAFSQVSIADLNPEQIQVWEAAMMENGLSSSTVGKAHRLLKQVMKEAVSLEVIPKNPVDPVKPPKRVKVHPGINSLDTQTRTELLNHLNAMSLSRTIVAVELSLYTGMREGEICALRWQDIDFDANVIWVRQAIGRCDGGTYLKQTKTDRVRDVAMPESLSRILSKWRQSQRLTFAAQGATLDGDSYVLGDALGYINPQTISHEWHALAQAFGIKGTEGRIPTFHDLRHTWATLYLAAGGDVKTASSNLGHANAAMTLNIYASADPQAKREAARLTEQAMTNPPAKIYRLKSVSD